VPVRRLAGLDPLDYPAPADPPPDGGAAGLSARQPPPVGRAAGPLEEASTAPPEPLVIAQPARYNTGYGERFAAYRPLAQPVGS
jgi:hypothetical protein